MTVFILQKLVPIDSAPALTAAVGHHSQLAIDSATGDLYINQNTTWSKIRAGDGSVVTPPVSGAVTVKNSAGTVSRNLTANNGIVTLAASDAIVANNDSIALQKSTGAAATGTATLNSPATAIVTAGVVSAVKASA